MKGRVKWYEPKKGYGFILSQDDRDVFFTRYSFLNNIQSLKQDDELEFDIVRGEKGWSAEKIKMTL